MDTVALSFSVALEDEAVATGEAGEAAAIGASCMARNFFEQLGRRRSSSR